MSIEYDHLPSRHSVEAPEIILGFILEAHPATSILDVGCGRGTWLHAAIKLGLSDVTGIDGVKISTELLHFPPDRFLTTDLTKDWSLGRRFDLAVCTEVGEHLESTYADHLIASLAQHSDTVVFSAACPGQHGQHHVNCQTPAYWQEIFNRYGFACSDSIRWRIWNNAKVEPWYRQNLFSATRDPRAGMEDRLPFVIHPEMFPLVSLGEHPPSFPTHRAFIEEGSMPADWYFKLPFRVAVGKMRRFLRRTRHSVEAAQPSA